MNCYLKTHFVDVAVLTIIQNISRQNRGLNQQTASKIRNGGRQLANLLPPPHTHLTSSGNQIAS